MNILIITRDFLPNSGGIAIFIHHLADQLGRRGHTVKIIAQRQSGWELVQSRHYTVCWCPTWKRFSYLPFIFQTMCLARSIKAEKIFLGHFMSIHGLGAVLASRLFGIPYIFLTHGNDLVYSITTKRDKWAASSILKYASFGLCNSRFTSGTLAEKGYEGSIGILHPGVDTNLFRPDLETNTLSEQYHLAGKKVLLSVSRLVAIKNIDGVLKSLPLVIREVPNLLYLIIGDGPQRLELESLVAILGLTEYVCFLGRIDNNQLPGFYCASDLYVMPSFNETFGISFSEAAACACPVVGSHVGGIAEAVTDGVTGLLADPHNPASIAQALLKILTDEPFARQLGKNGRKRVVEELSWGEIGEQFNSLLTQLGGLE